MMTPNGTARLASRCDTLVVRGVRYNVRRWGRATGRPILFLHGTQDSSITFQFVVERLRGDWCVIAPDWRGHGHSQWVSQGYWFHEFVADLDILVDALFSERSVPIVGHSLGGNIASVFAGLRPDRLTHLISLDGFGPLANLIPVDVKQILSRLLAIPDASRGRTRYRGVDEMAARLARRNPRLTAERARFLAEHSSAEDGQGGRRWLFDPSHERSLPSLHSLDEWGQVWAGIRVPVLWVASSDRRPFAPVSIPGEMDRRAAMMPGVKRINIPGTGHNLHHDAPEEVAGLIERFVENPDHLAFLEQALVVPSDVMKNINLGG
jgi:pimeloyl-ACP methyl ester carboxylesterase